MGSGAGGGGEGPPDFASKIHGEEARHGIMRRRLLLLGLPWAALVAAAPAPAPVVLPPPDLAPLVETAGAPLEKPSLPVPELPIPAPPATLPALPTPRLVLDPTITKPVLAMRAVSCNLVGTLLGSVSALVDCGREHYDNGRYVKAVQYFEDALGKDPDRDAARLARYWLGETLYKVNRSWSRLDAVARSPSRSWAGGRRPGKRGRSSPTAPPPFSPARPGSGSASAWVGSASMAPRSTSSGASSRTRHRRRCSPRRSCISAGGSTAPTAPRRR